MIFLLGDAIDKLAKEKGLDKIDSHKIYKLIKTGAKKRNTHGYPDKFDVITGQVVAIGKDEYIWIGVTNNYDWYKTSPVLSCKEIKNGFEIETQYSFYILEEHAPLE